MSYNIPVYAMNEGKERGMNKMIKWLVDLWRIMSLKRTWI